MIVTNVYEFLEAIDPQAYVGIDALTLTGKTPLSILGLRGALVTLKDKLATEEVKPFVYQGAKGFSQGPLRYASKEDAFQKKLWAILMITGPLSEMALKWLDFDLTATRVDLRVDVVLREQRKDLAGMPYRANGEKGLLIESLLGSTYYPTEKRESTYYARIYNKSPEYGEDMGWVWRWEVEIKREAAAEIAEILQECHDVSGFIEDTVFGIFEENWGVPVPKAGIKPKINYVGGHVISPEAKLDWIRRNVAKTVRHLKKVGYTEELEQLFKI